jgi:hypothetical protein
MKYIMALLYYGNTIFVAYVIYTVGNRGIAIAYTLISALLIIAIKMVPHKYIVSLGKCPRWSYYNETVMIASWAGIAIASWWSLIPVLLSNPLAYACFAVPRLLFSITFSVWGILSNRVVAA